jgi:hypothetical protein
MNVIRLLKRLLTNDRRALSAPILALIFIIVGVALALVAASIAGGFLFGFGASPRVTIERVDVLVDPVNGRGYVTIDIRNSGGAPLTGCTVKLVTDADNGFTPSNTESADLNLNLNLNLNPGQLTTVTGRIDDAQSGQVYVFRVRCTGPGGATVQDQKSAVGHI